MHILKTKQRTSLERICLLSKTYSARNLTAAKGSSRNLIWYFFPPLFFTCYLDLVSNILLLRQSSKKHLYLMLLFWDHIGWSPPTTKMKSAFRPRDWAQQNINRRMYKPLIIYWFIHSWVIQTTHGMVHPSGCLLLSMVSYRNAVCIYLKSISTYSPTSAFIDIVLFGRGTIGRRRSLCRASVATYKP